MGHQPHSPSCTSCASTCATSRRMCIMLRCCCHSSFTMRLYYPTGIILGSCCPRHRLVATQPTTTACTMQRRCWCKPHKPSPGLPPCQGTHSCSLERCNIPSMHCQVQPEHPASRWLPRPPVCMATTSMAPIFSGLLGLVCCHSRLVVAPRAVRATDSLVMC